MLRTLIAMAYQTGKIGVFLEPIALYGTKDLNEPGDGLWMGQYPDLGESIAPGEVASVGEGEIQVISFANGYYLARQAQHELANKHQIAIKVIDLRWLSPLPMASLIKALKGAKAILIVDETRSSRSVSEGLTTLLLEQMRHQCPIKRLTAEDCFIPLGPAMQLMLPSKAQIIEAVMSMETGFHSL